MKTITHDEQISTNGQSATYREISKSDDGRHTLRIEIKTDTHTPQQHATIERHDGTRWYQLASLLPGAMQSDKGLAYKPQRPSPSDFKTDRARLLEIAGDILD